MPAHQAAHLVGVQASMLGNRGELVQPYVTTRLTRSYVKFEMQFQDDCDLDDMAPSLFASLGGVDHLCQVRRELDAEFGELSLFPPVRSSEHTQEGYFSAETLAEVIRLDAALCRSYF